MFKAFLCLELSIAKRYRFRLFTDFFHLLVTLVLFFYISKSIGFSETFNGEYFPFLLIGLLFSRIYQTLIGSSVSELVDYQYLGVLESIVSTPERNWKLFLWSGTPSILRDLVFTIVAIIIVQFGLKMDIISWTQFSPLIFIATLFLTAIFCLSLSMISVASILYWKRVNLITAFSSLATSLLTGVYFPLKVLPVWLQEIANLIPFTHALALIRYSIGGSVEAIHPGQSLFVLSIWTFTTTLFSLFFYRKIEMKVLHEGKLASI